jgi:hypothetical protein
MGKKIALVGEMISSYGTRDYELGQRYRKHIEGGGRRFFAGETNPFVETFIVTRRIDRETKSFYGWDGMYLELGDEVLALKFFIRVRFLLGGAGNLEPKQKGVLVSSKDMDIVTTRTSLEANLCQNLAPFMIRGIDGPVEMNGSSGRSKKTLTVKIQTAGGVLGIKG